MMETRRHQQEEVPYEGTISNPTHYLEGSIFYNFYIHSFFLHTLVNNTRVVINVF
jgi:hypothetical protein